MAQVKVVFFIPLKDNDGRALTVEKDDLEMELFVRFVGWTFLGIVQGAYRMKNGARAIDEHRAYAIILAVQRVSYAAGIWGTCGNAL